MFRVGLGSIIINVVVVVVDCTIINNYYNNFYCFQRDCQLMQFIIILVCSYNNNC